MEFGEKLREAREANGITQQTLADQLYVKRQAVSRWECGSRFPDLLTAKKAAEILEVSLDDLLSGEKSQKFLEGNPINTSSKATTIQAGLYGFSGTCYIVFSALRITTFFIYGSYGHIILERIFVFSQELLWEIIQFETISMDNFIMDILSLLGNLIFCGLIIYQTYALHKKRCLAART